MTPKYDINDIVEMKKQHACGTNRFKIIRMGADIRIKCEIVKKYYDSNDKCLIKK